MASTYLIMYKNELFVDEFDVSNSREDSGLKDAKIFISTLSDDIRKHVDVVHENCIEEEDDDCCLVFSEEDLRIRDEISDRWEEFLLQM